MTQHDDNFARDLNQIRERQMAVLDEIDELAKAYPALPPEIEKIQKDALAIVHEIDALREQ